MIAVVNCISMLFQNEKKESGSGGGYKRREFLIPEKKLFIQSYRAML